MQQITPYKNTSKSKKKQISEMFDNISTHYDFLNHFLSMGIDILWRQKAISLLKNKRHEKILDVATGTGDLAIEASKLNPKEIVGVDISEKMLILGRKKIKEKGLEDKIRLVSGDSEKLPLKDQSFDVVTVGFGVRNFENLEKGLSEMHRVLKKEGKTVILEFSKPKIFPLNLMFNFYFKKILPNIGKLISKDNSAYTYLPQSVEAFPDGENFLKIMKKTGFKKTKQIGLTFGIASIYTGEK